MTAVNKWGKFSPSTSSKGAFELQSQKQSRLFGKKQASQMVSKSRIFSQHSEMHYCSYRRKRTRAIGLTVAMMGSSLSLSGRPSTCIPDRRDCSRATIGREGKTTRRCGPTP